MNWTSSFADGSKFFGVKSITYENNRIKLVEETVYEKNGDLSHKKITQDEGSGKTVEITYYADGKESNRDITYVYENEKGQKVIERWYGLTSRKYREITTVSSDSIEIKKIELNKDNSPSYEITFIYDKKSGIIKSKTDSNYEYKYEYKFDSNGNWINRTTSQKVNKFGKIYFEPFYVITREITYYATTQKRKRRN